MNQEEKIAKANGIELKWDMLRKKPGCTYEDMARFAMNAIPTLVAIVKKPIVEEAKEKQKIVNYPKEGL